MGRPVRPLGVSSPRGLTLLFAISVAAFIACSSPETFRGTELTARAPATSFTLTNQFSRAVSLDDYRGKVVLLTFLYTNCPDICPLTTSHIREAYELLESDAADLAMIAVSVDPERDTVEGALAFSQHWQMTDRWDFLTGPRPELERIWRAYYIDPSVDSSSDSHESSTASPQQRLAGGVGALRQDILGQPAPSAGSGPALSKARGEPVEPSKGPLVSHASPVYLVDRAGRMRAVHTLPFEPNALAHDIRLLID